MSSSAYSSLPKMSGGAFSRRSPSIARRADSSAAAASPPRPGVNGVEVVGHGLKVIFESPQDRHVRVGPHASDGEAKQRVLPRYRGAIANKARTPWPGRMEATSTSSVTGSRTSVRPTASAARW